MPRLLIFTLLFALACKDDKPADDSSVSDDSTVADDSSAAVDADGDGYDAESDCDDNDPTVHPNADELCNDRDDDCDGVADEDAIDAATYYSDNDRDGFGQGEGTLSCLQPPDTATQGGDCDDADETVYPDAPERCDGIDNDCDSDIDEEVQSTWYADQDRDGHGDPGSVLEDCDPPEGYAATGDDCDDATSSTFPGAPELCNGVDDDCDGQLDEEATDATTWYQDADQDGYGDTNFSVQTCEEPAGYAAEAGDCEDGDGTIHPNAPEQCNGIDDDCDGAADEDGADAATWYADGDGDGYGDPNTGTAACAAPSGTVADATDCDDGAVDVNPGAVELCNGIDDNCDGDVDEDAAADAAIWYMDGDGDGYGDPTASMQACAAPSGTVSDATDCDDGDGGVNPGATEVCNSVDDDCDTLVDDDDGDVDLSTGNTYYRDADGDTYGDPSLSQMACSRPAGYRPRNTDCDDGDSAVNPAATEVCNGVDDDCNLTIDDGLLGTGAACPASDCLEILSADPSAADGTWWVDVNGTPTELECDMSDGGWTLVFADDFETTPDSGWSLQSTSVCGSFSTILGGYGIIAGGSITNTISTLGLSHTEAMVALDYIKLDSWDGELAYVQVDGSTVWSDNLYYYEGSEVCGWNRGWDGSYDNREPVSATVSHSAATLALTAASQLNQDAGDESFGIDNVEVWVR